MAHFVRTQGLICGILNVVINPVLAWALNRSMDDVPVAGVAVDTAVTCLVLSLLVSLFTTAGVARALRTGELLEPAGGRPLNPWGLGLAMGLGAACVAAPLAFGLFHALGVSRLPFPAFALFKACYTGPLGYAVTRWVILRQLDAVGRPSAARRR